MPVDDGSENSGEGVVVELEEAEDVKVPEQARGDVIPPPPWRSHRAHHDGVHDGLPGHVLEVVPGKRTERVQCGHERRTLHTPRRFSAQ